MLGSRGIPSGRNSFKDGFAESLHRTRKECAGGMGQADLSLHGRRDTDGHQIRWDLCQQELGDHADPQPFADHGEQRGEVTHFVGHVHGGVHFPKGCAEHWFTAKFRQDEGFAGQLVKGHLLSDGQVVG